MNPEDERIEQLCTGSPQ